MSEKDPFVTRAELRKKMREQEQEQRSEQRKRERASEQEFSQREKEINRFYRREAKKTQPMRKTRSGENQKSRKLNNFLLRSIWLIFFLFVLVLLAIFFL